ncbi:H+/Cl- antiporter ClcA [Rhodococcus sp. OK519]|uniref:ion channel protein n=1 Tax=Rhodococcus sp. OK519 TaxID=2135729 RepID=UPI000D45FA0E|nr:H+/Cl- antiporter ClcA [Rhodococcus sp. OK519]
MTDEEHPAARVIACEAVLAVLVGVAATAVPIAVLAAARVLAVFLYERVPDALGFSGDARWWPVAVLTSAGVVVGLIVWLVPGHGGRDSATAGLIGPLMPLRVLPSLLLALVIALGAGVSLSPENVLVAVNAALAVWVLARMAPTVASDRVVVLATAATIGVQFGTPIAAPLAYLELTGRRVRGNLWDAVSAPLVAAGAGTMTMAILDRPVLALDMPDYGTTTLRDLIGGMAIATVTAVAMLAAVYAYRGLHTLFHRVHNPVLMTGAAGVVLGLVGALGGRESMFKDVSTMRSLVDEAPNLSILRLTVLGLCSLVAFSVAAAGGFRGGRVIASAAIGVTAGLLGHALMPAVPVTLAIACGVLGAVVVAVRSCWLGIFIPVAMAGSVSVLPALCLAVLPVWLLVVHRPTMTIRVFRGSPGGR